MRTRTERVAVGPRRMAAYVGQRLRANPGWHFYADTLQLIWEYKLFGLAILAVTVAQEFAALWPVQLLGQFVDRLQTGDLGNVVFLFLGASLLHPLIARGNVILRHKMLYETDYQKRVELTLQVADEAGAKDGEAAGSSHTSLVQAVSGVTNATHHLLGSFTPVLIKLVVVGSRLLAYNALLGLAYVGSLIIPVLLTLLFNNKLRVLRDSQYSIVSRTSGAGIKTIMARDDTETRERFLHAMRERTDILISLIARSQTFLYVRQSVLVGSQFLVVFLALGMRERLGLTPGDFTQIIGYTAQVAVAFLSSVSFVDNIVSYSRACHVYRQQHRPPAVGVVRSRPVLRDPGPPDLAIGTQPQGHDASPAAWHGSPVHHRRARSAPGATAEPLRAYPLEILDGEIRPCRLPAGCSGDIHRK
jgi:ABC-type multidrug transport system fused ATPase/permease subunit